jgi:chromosome partitioning protein
MKCIAIFSTKGGVGKSTVAMHLAHMAATRSGRRTLLWDLDAQGGATHMLGLAGKPRHTAQSLFARHATMSGAAVSTPTANFDLLPADRSLRRIEVQLAEQDKKKRMRRLVEEAAESYDRIILDCPPTFGELSDQLLRSANLLVVPVIPSPLSMHAYRTLMSEVAARHGRLRVLPFFSMVDRRRRLHREMLAAAPDWLAIPYSSRLEAMSVTGTPVTAKAPGSAAAAALSALWSRAEQMLAAPASG